MSGRPGETTINELVSKYDHRLLTESDLRNGIRVKPMDFIVVTSWDGLSMVAENLSDHRMRARMDDKDLRKYLDIEFVSCVFDEGEYQGTVFAAVPYTVTDEYKTMKNKLTQIFMSLNLYRKVDNLFDEEERE